MASDPEFIQGNVFVANTDIAIGILKNDCGQLFHFESLGIVFANVVDVGNVMVQVKLSWIDDQVFTGHDESPPASRCGLSGVLPSARGR